MTQDIAKQLAENLGEIRERMTQASQRAERSPDDVRMIAVTKYAQLDWVKELMNLGIHEFGEARPQQLISRARQFPSHVVWHLIGHLQRNKAEDVLPVANLIHSVDSQRLFEHIAKLGPLQNRRPAILLEVNVSSEPSKDGFAPADLLAAWPEMQRCEFVEIRGLMTMAPLSNHAESARPVFQRLRELRDRLRAESQDRWPLDELSMGMSGDFEIGIEEGATIVRIGSHLFKGLAAEET